MLLYALLGACALGAGFLVWRHDMYDREPWWALVGTALLGALLMAACGALENRTIYGATGTPTTAWIAANAAVIEEAARMAAVLAVALLLPRTFNDPMDGITYGSMAGLGMSLYESTFYLGPDALPEGGPGAMEIARLCSHIVLGGIAGFPFGLWRTGMKGAGIAFALCAPGAAALHFTVDWEGLRSLEDPGLLPGATLVVCIAVVAGAGAYGGITAQASEWSRQRFAPCSTRTLFGWPLNLFTKKPVIPDWCPPRDPRDGG